MSQEETLELILTRINEMRTDVKELFGKLEKHETQIELIKERHESCSKTTDRRMTSMEEKPKENRNLVKDLLTIGGIIGAWAFSIIQFWVANHKGNP